MYFALTFQKVTYEYQSQFNFIDHFNADQPWKHTNTDNSDKRHSVSAQKILITPLRQFFGELPPLIKGDSDGTLDGSNLLDAMSKREKKIRSYYSISTWCGICLGLLLVAYYLFAIYYLFGHEKGLIHSIIITICIALFSHFFFGGFSLRPMQLSKNQSKASYGLGIFYSIIAIIAVTESGDFSLYISASLWPLCCVLLVNDPFRHNQEKKTTLITFN